MVVGFINMANVNNVMYFDEMNILKADKDMRVRMCDKLEKELIDIFEWVSNFGIHFFYWEILDKKMHDRYVKIILEEYKEIEDKEELIELLAYEFFENTTQLIEEADGDKEKLKKALSKERARICARNETNKAVETLNYDDAVSKGFRKKKWKTMLDGKERPSHRNANGQIVDINEPFTIGGSKMLHPFDTTFDAPLSEILNCRCTVEYLK